MSLLRLDLKRHCTFHLGCTLSLLEASSHVRAALAEDHVLRLEDFLLTFMHMNLETGLLTPSSLPDGSPSLLIQRHPSSQIPDLRNE